MSFVKSTNKYISDAAVYLLLSDILPVHRPPSSNAAFGSERSSSDRVLTNFCQAQKENPFFFSLSQTRSARSATYKYKRTYLTKEGSPRPENNLIFLPEEDFRLLFIWHNYFFCFGSSWNCCTNTRSGLLSLSWLLSSVILRKSRRILVVRRRFPLSLSF